MRIAVARISPGDLVELATDVGPAPMNVGAVLLLAPPVAGPVGGSVEELHVVLAERLSQIHRLRQRLVTGRGALGRPYWLDDATSDIGRHLSRVECPVGSSLADVVTTAAREVTTPLARDRPLWRAVLMTGLDDGQVALVLTVHHVVADGIGGLAVLGALADEAVRDVASVRPVASPRGGPAARAPGPTDLLADRARAVCGAFARLPVAVRRTWQGRSELGSFPRRAPICSLNAPTGQHRAVRTIEVDLEPVRSAGHRTGSTVNDALLVAVTGAMTQILLARGESVSELVVSVPVSARASTTSADLGNQVGVMPVRVPVTGALAARLAAVAGLTKAQKGRVRGSSAALVGPAFRLLARAGMFGWFVNRQRLVNSFLTNMTGPSQRLTLGGWRIEAIVPITVTAGNVGVAFAALSYAGRLRVTVIADPQVVPEVDLLATAVGSTLEAIAGCLVGVSGPGGTHASPSARPLSSGGTG
jgi:diacylglycerol O-acyltransferase